MEIFTPGAKADPRDRKIETLEAEVRRLTRAVAAANEDAESAHRDTARALAALRRQLTPLYQALQSVFGELDAVGVEMPTTAAAPDGVEPAAPANARVAAVWESWKAKLPGKPAEFISILLDHGEMSHAQLKIAGRCGSDTVYRTITKLNGAGLINKNGGRFSLKQL